MKNRAGTYVSNMSGELSYDSFLPAKLPPNPPLEMKDDLFGLTIEANAKLAELNSISHRVPDMDIFISMYVYKEALLSSQIEGTQATLEDIFDPRISKNTNRDVEDVVNYVSAIQFALNRMNELPLCNRLLLETHAVLMKGVRGEEKSPGEFRRSQNWIGGVGSTISTAHYIPPNVENMQDSLESLEEYINEENNINVLVNAALIHYQFETIHPFLDGNGRIGRLLIILYLIEKGALNLPVLYISYFLKRNRIEYYDRMSDVRTSGNFEQWVKFFLLAISETCADAVKAISELDELHRRNIRIIENCGKASRNMVKLFMLLEQCPIIEVSKSADDLGLSYNTVASCVKQFQDLGILEQVNQGARNKIFAYSEYLDILNSGI